MLPEYPAFVGDCGYFWRIHRPLMGYTTVVPPTESDTDGLVDKALAVLREAERISVSMLQRHLNVGYTKNLIRQLEEDGYGIPVGKWNYVLKK